jgi:hypothetical protein
MNPTLAGFQAFIAGVMGIDPLYLPPDSPAIGWAYTVALMDVNPDLALIGSPSGAPMQTSMYALAVYNLAGDNLINFAPDQPGRTYFAELRKSMGISAFAAGVVTSASDSGTSDSLAVSDALHNLTLGQLQNLKTPYGRQYLALAQNAGTMWGLA